MLVHDRIENGQIISYSMVDAAITHLRSYEPPEGYWLAFSGGKDSCVILALAKMAGVKFHAYYSLTTLDPPELVLFIKQYYPEVEIIHEYGKESYKNKKLLMYHIKSAIYYFNKWGWIFDKERDKLNKRFKKGS